MKTLAKKLKKLLKNKNIIDLIIFGSFAKGKINANDIDIAVITNEEINRNELQDQIFKIIKKEVHIQKFTINDYDKFIIITLIREGFSIKHSKYLAEIYQLKPVILFKYELKSLTASQKVMFSRAIKIFKNIQKLSNRVVLVPIELSGEFNNLLRRWNIDIESQEYNLLPLVRK
ncbi:MAG: nucleotidyltransferase domain-containing protein [Nanoarchaeota archaeon]|nr:nucleotidyltransferase domain-containing protein [Nanoarchaeota archaeon]MBU1632038.1 nucleotidyltransferase domain-containing protein [Nanoarchaeota archaeon]MBU1875954.1 nucleotidyltransferase domain-containing protein [Nanoarchaeota archaeon]